MQDFFVLIVVSNERGNSTLVLKGNRFRIFIIACIVKSDAYAFVKEGKLSEPIPEDIVRKIECVKYFGIGHKCRPSPRFSAFTGFLYGSLWNTPRVALLIDSSVLIDLNVEPFGERIDTGGANTVQATRGLVADLFSTIKFTTGVQCRHDDFKGGNACRVCINRDASTVITDGYATITMEFNFNLRPVTGTYFVYGIVNQFCDEMV